MTAIDRRAFLRAGAGLGVAMAAGPLDVLGLFGPARAEAATARRPGGRPTTAATGP